MQNNISVVIINGKPRSGKDTFCKYIEEYCEELGKDCYTWSSIDNEKEILQEWIKPYDSDGEWTDTDRAFLSDLKKLLNSYYDYTFDSFRAQMMFSTGIVLIHSREWEEIERFKEYCNDNKIKCMTLFIRNDNLEKNYSNSSDMNCDENEDKYDFHINNHGTLEELKENARKFCNEKLL